MKLTTFNVNGVNGRFPPRLRPDAALGADPSVRDRRWSPRPWLQSRSFATCAGKAPDSSHLDKCTIDQASCAVLAGTLAEVATEALRPPVEAR